jgi:hypothetical protein
VRVSHLKGLASGGLNSSFFLSETTVHDDGDKDQLRGNSGKDWFFANMDGDGDKKKKDDLAGAVAGEEITDIDL